LPHINLTNLSVYEKTFYSPLYSWENYGTHVFSSASNTNSRRAWSCVILCPLSAPVTGPGTEGHCRITGLPINWQTK
jgi:hypothetical protein